jgi:hypothetical protein
MALSVAQWQLTKGILPVSKLLKHSRDVMDQIESLHCALELSRRSYTSFYDTVAVPLVSRRG